MVALDFLLVLLTSACIVYCMLLNRRIIQIQKYRAEMLKIFKEFDKSIEKAEKILEDTKKITPKTDKIIKELEINVAKQTAKLELLINQSDTMAEELETLIISGNRVLGKLHNYNKAQLSFEEENYIEEHSSDISTKADKYNNEKLKLSQQDYYEILQEKRRGRK